MKQGKNGIDRIGHMVYQNFIILQMWNVFLALICVCIYSSYSSWRGRGTSRCSAPQSFQRSSPRCRPRGGFHFTAIRKSSIIWTPPIVAILLWCPDVSSSHMQPSLSSFPSPWGPWGKTPKLWCSPAWPTSWPTLKRPGLRSCSVSTQFFARFTRWSVLLPLSRLRSSTLLLPLCTVWPHCGGLVSKKNCRFGSDQLDACTFCLNGLKTKNQRLS